MRLLHVHQRLIGVAKAAAAGDAESAHDLEDKLFVDVLTEIAKGEGDAAELAKAALRSRELEFPRWCA